METLKIPTDFARATLSAREYKLLFYLAIPYEIRPDRA